MTTPEENIYFGPESNIIAPTLQETLGVIRDLKNNRAPEEDSITSVMSVYLPFFIFSPCILLYSIFITNSCTYLLKTLSQFIFKTTN